MASQQREIEALRDQVKTRQASQAGSEQAPRVIDAAMNTAIPSDAIPAGNVLGANAGQQSMPPTKDKKKNRRCPSRLARRIFTPGGFVDIENIFRTTNTQNNIATNYAAIPFSNTAQGHLTEYRLTAQFSRSDITSRDKFGANDVTAYCEADFSGNDATNVYQTVNGHTLRVRLCFMDLKRGKWEVLGGQTWSWLTPNRKGVGPNARR